MIVSLMYSLPPCLFAGSGCEASGLLRGAAHAAHTALEGRLNAARTLLPWYCFLNYAAIQPAPTPVSRSTAVR